MTVVLITGSDDPIVTEALNGAVNKALDGEDPNLALEELTEEDYRVDDGFQIDRLVVAAQTPPFLTGRRVVVGRHAGRFGSAEEVAPLVLYLQNSIPTTSLVLVWEKGVQPAQQRLSSVPKALVDAIRGADGEIHDCTVGRGRDADHWLTRRLADSAVSLDAQASALVIEQVGEDRSRIVGLLATLSGVFGTTTTLGVSDVKPYLGQAGEVPPWALTDAIEAGDIPATIGCLHRMLRAGDRHPLAVLSGLYSHYERLLRLDGSGITEERVVAETLGINAYPAKKALLAARRMGSEKITRSFRLIADADLDLRGRVGWPPELVMEVLVARLATFARR